jgi:predicted ATPase
MATITIKNVGPIKNIENLELNKVNVFMGPQSSGKSTIAKIISYCTWVEKRHMLDGFFREDFLERLKTFHNFEETYFPSDAYFRYEGDYCKIEFSKKDKPEGEIIVKGKAKFENSKHIYIPAERNFVASIPNLGRYRETNNNIMDFLYYWYDAKKSYSKKNSLEIATLGISFYHIEEEDKDVVVLNNNKEIILRNASSGIQSMLPLYLLLDYLTDILYQKEVVLSPFEQEQLKKQVEPLFDQHFKEIEKQAENIKQESRETEISNKVNKKIDEILSEQTKSELFNQIIQSVENKYKESRKYCFSQFIIEEPEQNLFPSTQQGLVYHLLNLITKNRDHQLTITTHSPYILYALNNCMMGYLVKDKMPKEEQEELLSKSSWINPEEVSIYQIKEGEIISIKDRETKVVGEHYFNGVMGALMDEYYEMLNYFE